MVVEIGMFTYEWIIRQRRSSRTVSVDLESCLHEAGAALEVQDGGESRPRRLEEISAITEEMHVS